MNLNLPYLPTYTFNLGKQRPTLSMYDTHS